MEVSVGDDGDGDSNGCRNWGCGGNYVNRTGWAVVGDEPRPCVKLYRTIDEPDWSFMFYLIYEVIYLR